MNCTDRRGNKQHFGARVYEATRNFLTGFQLEVKAPENTSEKHSEIFMNHFTQAVCKEELLWRYNADAFGDMRQWSNRKWHIFTFLWGMICYSMNSMNSDIVRSEPDRSYDEHAHAVSNALTWFNFSHPALSSSSYDWSVFHSTQSICAIKHD